RGGYSIRTMRMRDDFSADAKDALAKRVSMRCSNPGCHRPTSGPRADPWKAVNIGVAAHITAASPGRPRFAEFLTIFERHSIENVIWLCQNCAKLVDNDPSRYTATILRDWKRLAEASAQVQLESSAEPAPDHGSLNELVAIVETRAGIIIAEMDQR